MTTQPKHYGQLTGPAAPACKGWSGAAGIVPRHLTGRHRHTDRWRLVADGRRQGAVGGEQVTSADLHGWAKGQHD